MHIAHISFENFRSFNSVGPISPGRINILVGENNSGKSSVLKAVHAIQGSAGNLQEDVRRVENLENIYAKVDIWLENAREFKFWHQVDDTNVHAQVRISTQNPTEVSINNGSRFQPILPIAPRHFIVPYLSKRKAAGFNQTVNETTVNAVTGDLSMLAAKLATIGQSSHRHNKAYASACEAILGFTVVAIPSSGGQRPGAFMPDGSTIFIDQMGEGVANIVGLLADLVTAHGKVFLVEKPENDLHPRALKAVLDLIVEASQNNQFFVSTHSNIVLRHLAAAEDGRIYKVSSEKGVLPSTATLTEVQNSVQGRQEILRELGYEFSDFDLFSGWLILEEASAETIIRGYLIPHFAPRLARVRTLAAGGTGEVEPSFREFYRMIRFTHLEEAYKDVVWVRVDGDASGKTVVDELREKYKSWQPEKFSTFSKPQFEDYYPEVFSKKAAEVLGISDKRVRREEKRKLLLDVVNWLDQDVDRAKTALEKSAREVIDQLQRIEKELISSQT